MSTDLYNHKTFLQKLKYIHRNPVQERWSLAGTVEEYKYSSARFYETGGDGWDFSPITKSNYNCVVGEQHQQRRKDHNEQVWR